MPPDEMFELPDAIAILFAVSHTSDGCELTVFENGEACSVVLSPLMVEQLVLLLGAGSGEEQPIQGASYDDVLDQYAAERIASHAAVLPRKRPQPAFVVRSKLRARLRSARAAPADSIPGDL